METLTRLVIAKALGKGKMKRQSRKSSLGHCSGGCLSFYVFSNLYHVQYQA